MIDTEIRLVIERYRQMHGDFPAAVLMDVEKYEALCRLVTERNSYSMQSPLLLKDVIGVPITIAPAEVGPCLACLHPGDPHEQAARVSEAALRGLIIRQRRAAVE